MSLEELTVKELKEKVIALGMPEEDAEAFKTKAPLIASIRTLEAKEMTADAPRQAVEEEPKRVATLEERPDPREEKRVNTEWKNKAEAMKHRLLGQPTVSILIPLEPAESKGIVVWAYTKSGDKMADDVWNKLSLEEKMETHQVHVAGAIESVQLNGYKFFIPKGVYTPVPQQVAEVIAKSQQQTLDAGADIKLDRIDPKTGRPFSEIL